MFGCVGTTFGVVCLPAGRTNDKKDYRRIALRSHCHSSEAKAGWGNGVCRLDVCLLSMGFGWGGGGAVIISMLTHWMQLLSMFSLVVLCVVSKTLRLLPFLFVDML